MPNIANAKKALRQQKRKTIVNVRTKRAYKEAVKAFKANPSAEALNTVFSTVDTASKKGILAMRTAARIKRNLSLMVAKAVA